MQQFVQELGGHRPPTGRSWTLCANVMLLQQTPVVRIWMAFRVPLQVTAAQKKTLICTVRFWESMSYNGQHPVIGLALLLLPAAALLGCWFPARRAASSNPAQII